MESRIEMQKAKSKLKTQNVKLKSQNLKTQLAVPMQEPGNEFLLSFQF